MNTTVTKVLSGHVSPETAYVVEDYPFGFTLRCKIRFWLEYKAKKGVRFCSQTTNPKRPGEVWNTAKKASTYCRFGGAMYLDEQGHVQWSGLSQYVDGAEASAWFEQFKAGLPAGEAYEVAEAWVRAKVAYDKARAEGVDMAQAGRIAALAAAKKGGLKDHG
jgi:hypothetical protein